MRGFIGAALAAALVGCVTTGNTIIGSETAGAGYQNWPLKMNTTMGEVVSYKLWLRPHNKDGLLGLCGYIEVESASSVSQQLLATVWSSAEISVNDQPVGSGAYLPLRGYNDKRATCVKTIVPWNESFTRPLKLNAKFDRGSRVFF